MTQFKTFRIVRGVIDIGDPSMLKQSALKLSTMRTGLKRSLWSKGSPEPWYSSHDSDKMTWKKVLKKSLLAYIGLELVIYLVFYFIVNVIYRAGLDDKQQREFEKVVAYFKHEVSPLSRDLTFLLGFYVSLVIKRWWEQYKSLPWPDKLGLLNTGLTLYESDESRTLSEELSRYQMLSYVLCMRKISKVIRNEFPNTSDLVDAGLITNKELKVLEEHGPLDALWWLPLQWSMHRIKVAKQKKIIPSDHKELLRAVTGFKSKLDAVESYQHVPIPPVYRQVVYLAVYVYFICALIGSQVTANDPETYFPVFLVLKFIFFVGWLKVAEALKNPFGDDGDDFEIGPLLSRHIWACGLHLELGFRGLPDDDDDDNGDLLLIETKDH